MTSLQCKYKHYVVMVVEWQDERDANNQSINIFCLTKREKAADLG